MADIPRITVVIPNWNGREFLEVCLPSLREQSFTGFETVVVDNGSTDGSRRLIEERFPEVRLIPLGENRGFSAAVNAGIQASSSPLIALLNNDTEQDGGWLAALEGEAEAHPECGLLASKLVDFHDRWLLDGAGDALRLSGLPYRVGHGERDRGQFDTGREVFGACAAAALYRREVFEEVGLFDEDFFAYCEDGDLSFRARLAGYRCRYVPGAVVYHMGSASSGGKRSEFATRLGTRNSISLLVKNVPLSVVPHILPFFIAGQLLRLAVCAATGTLGAHLRGLQEAGRQLPVMLARRRRIQAARRISDGEVRRMLRDSSLEAARSLARRLTDRARP